MKFKFVLITLLCLFMTGCGNYTELNEIAIVTGMGIDKENDSYNVTLMIANTQVDAAQNEAKTSIVMGNGNSLSEAMNDLELKIPDSIYLGHLSVLVIAADLAYNGVNNIVEYVIKNYEMNQNHFLVLAKDDKAEDILKVISPLDTFPSQSIASSIKNTTKSQGITTSVYFNDFVSSLVNQGIQGFLPSIYIDGKSSEEINEEISVKEVQTLKIGPLGIFRGTKLLGWLEDNESRGINIINNKTDNVFLINDFDDKKIIVKLYNLNCTKKVVFRNNKPEIDIEVISDAEIKEVSNNISMKEVRKKSTDSLNNIILESISASKDKYKSDIFGFGNMIYKDNYKYWNIIKDNWDIDGLNDIKVNVSSKISLKDDGPLKNMIKEQ